MTDPRYTTLIEASTLRDLMTQSDPLILDCTFYLADPDKGRQEYLTRHIDGAYFLDINKDLSGPVEPGVTGRHPLPAIDILISTLRQCGLRPRRQVIAYDQHNGMYASRAWWLLRWLGHDEVAVLNGGFAKWTSEGFPIDNHWPKPVAGDFVPHVHDQLMVDRHEVEYGLPNVVDSREWKRYTGESEPIDRVAGHIKGAVCIPFADNVHPDGTWQSREFLMRKFESIYLQDSPPVFYCGSGVTACHNLLAFKIATGKEGRLYAGSWSEWLNYHQPVTGQEAG